jgi:hypothetical protein
MLLLGRSPHCDLIIRRAGVAPVEFILEWMGDGEFDPLTGEWALVEVGLDRSEVSSVEIGTGVGHILVKDQKTILKGFEFTIKEDRLQARAMDKIISRSLRENESGREIEGAGLLEFIVLKKSVGRLEDVVHMDFESNVDRIAHPSFGGVELISSQTSDLDLKVYPGLRKMTASMQDYQSHNITPGKSFQFKLKKKEFVKLSTEEFEVLVRVTPKYVVPTTKPNFLKDRLTLASILALLIAIPLLYLISQVEMKPELNQTPPRIARIEIKEIAPEIKPAPPLPKPDESIPAPAPATPPPIEVEPPKEISSKGDVSKHAEGSSNKAPLAAPKKSVSPKPETNSINLVNDAPKKGVGSVGLLGAVKPASKGTVRPDMIANKGIVSESISGQNAHVIVPQSVSGAIGSKTTENQDSMATSGSGIATKDRGASELGLVTNTTRKSVDGFSEDPKTAVSGKNNDALGDEMIEGGLDRDSVRRAIAAYKNEVTNCYDRALLTKPNLSGRVSYKWYISPNGKTAWINIVKSDTDSSQLNLCVLEVIKKIPFPQAKAGTTVIYPFAFQAKNKQK